MIGTSIQAVLARLHAIRETGYAEDGTSTNMIEKALRAINQSLGTNLSLFKRGGREWKGAQVVFEEIADAWFRMDGVQRSYLTTMMAGTRQQDRFVNLMTAMADKTEGLSRYQELLTVAMAAGGTTQEKYNIWLESATAAQNKLTASLEQLYNTFGSMHILKGFYNMLSEIVSAFASGVSATGGITLWATALTGIVITVARLVKYIKELKGAIGFLMGGKFGVVLSAIALAGTAVTTMVGAFKGDEKPAPREVSVIEGDMKAHSEATRRYTGAIGGLVDKMRELEKEQGSTVKSGAEYESIMQALISAAPHLERVLKDQGGEFNTLGENIDNVTQSLIDYRVAQQNASSLRAKELLLSMAPALQASQEQINIVQGWTPADIAQLYDWYNDPHLRPFFDSIMTSTDRIEVHRDKYEHYNPMAHKLEDFKKLIDIEDVSPILSMLAGHRDDDRDYYDSD